MKKIPMLVLLVLGACAPDITQNAAPSTNVVVAEFDPGNAAVPIVPTPNDLALSPITGTISVPVPAGCPGSSNAPPGNGAKDGDETDVDCGGTSGRACDDGKACAVYGDCASGVCTAGKCVGGCPSDALQEFDSQYLGQMSGFPYESTATVLFSGEIDPGSVTAGQTVIVLDVTANQPVADATVQPAPAAINVLPPPKLWTRGHRYAVAVTNGIKAKDAQATVIASQTWALVSSSNPLVTCPNDDLKSPDCKPAIDIIPSTKSDPGEKLFDQTQKAVQLEQIRRGYDPLLKALEAAGHPRSTILVAWTFSIVDAGEVTFDPAHDTIPFPNDILRDPMTGKVNLPNPTNFKPLAPADCAMPASAQIALVCGLNTLDGFSTTVPPVSENSDAADAVAQAQIDPTTLAGGTVGLLPVKPGAPPLEQTKPKFTPCLNCTSSPDANGNPQTKPQQLQWRLDAPLDEKTTYLAWVTGGVKDTTGKNVVANPVFALLRSKAPIAANGKSLVPTLASDDQAAQLEPLRAAMAPAIDGAMLDRKNLALAWAFTTQSTVTLEAQLAQLPSNPALKLPDGPLYTQDATPTYFAAAAAGVQIDALGKVLVGAYLTANATTGPGNTLNPTMPEAEGVPFVVAIPCDKATGGAGCTSPYASAPPAYPVAIFGHGFTRSRNDMIIIANALAKVGFIAIAPDHVWHGERSSCTGSALFTAAGCAGGCPQFVGQAPSDDNACANPSTQKCNEAHIGRCVAKDASTRAACDPTGAGGQAVADAGCSLAGQGRCVAADKKCEGGDFLRLTSPTAFNAPVIGGLKSFNPGNFFETRDTFRQSTIDLAQLVRVLKGSGIGAMGPPAAPAGQPAGLPCAGCGLGVALAPGKISYVGQSLGSIYGTLFNAVSPDTNQVALNVGGGALTTLFLESPSLVDLRNAFLKALAQQSPPIVPGTPSFDNFIGIAQWVLDPADPRNYGYELTHGSVNAPPMSRSVFLQFIEGDQFVVNDSNFALVTAANRDFTPTPPKFNCQPPLYCYEFTEAGDMFDKTSAPLDKRHGFLLAPPSSPAGVPLTVKAQTQVSIFIATGAVP